MKRLTKPLGLFVLQAVVAVALPAKPAPDAEAIAYAEIDGRALLLDLYLPEPNAQKSPLLVWIHGGAWRAGSRENPPILPLLKRGWAIASVDYRLSGQARFPAQVHDIKAAVRFLRAKSSEFGYDASRIAIVGASAGGHLAALAGTTNGVSALEGAVGKHVNESSDIQAIVSYYGASNLTTILAQSTPHGISVRVPALELFLGPDDETREATARLASPVHHADPNDPPLLLLHGDQDPQMPINQSIEFLGAYRRLGLEVRFEPVHGAAHGGEAFYDEARNEIVDTFLRRHLSRSP